MRIILLAMVVLLSITSCEKDKLPKTVDGRTLVIRTATGKVAKVEILNYYRGGQTPSATAPDSIKTRDQRFLHFRYTYQGNGTRQF